MEEKNNYSEDRLASDGGPSFVRRGEISIEDFEAALNARAAEVEAELAMSQAAWEGALHPAAPCEETGNRTADRTAGLSAAQARDDRSARFERVTLSDAPARPDIMAAGQGDEENETRPATPTDETDEKHDDDDDEAMTDKKRHGHPILMAILLIFFVGFLGSIFYTYRHYADFFRTHFYSGTTVNGIDVSYMTADEAKQTIANSISGYELTIEELNGERETLSGEDIGLAYVDDLAVDRLIMDQDADLWFLSFGDEVTANVNVSVTYDEQKATSAVLQLKCLSYDKVVEPENACLVAEGSLYTIKPEVVGNKLDEAKLLGLVLDALDEGKTTCSLVDQDCYIYPTVTSDDENLNARLNAWNKYLSVELVYTFGDNREVINGETLRPYISDDGTAVTLSTDWVRTLVYQWGQKYDTFGLERQFITHKGKEITIPAGGDYGWVIDKDKTIADVERAVKEGVSGTREPIYLYKAMGWENGDLTGTYVEVSISDQKLWCYKDGVCILETDVVTGKGADPERATVTGCFAIDAKKKDAILGTEDVQGYSEPVGYWLPFNEGQGLHDAPWRTEFGGSVYLESGSHGCVNVPEDKMKTVFDAMEIGNAVVVYDLNAETA